MAALPLLLIETMTDKTFKLFFHYWSRKDSVPWAGPAPIQVPRKRSSQIRKAIKNKLFDEFQVYDQRDIRQENPWRESPGILARIRAKPPLRWQE